MRSSSFVGSFPTTPFEITFTGQTISFTANNVVQLVTPPDSTVTFNSSTPSGSTSFTSLAWSIKNTPSAPGNTFLGGALFKVPAGGLPANITDVSWCGTFGLPAGVTIHWQWAAAVYKANTAPTALGSLNVEANTNEPPGNPAGTPEAIKSFLASGGGTGGGGATTPARASSTGTLNCPLPSFGCSWAYVVWKYTNSDDGALHGLEGRQQHCLRERRGESEAGKHNEPVVKCRT